MYTLPKIDYGYDALEPYIDARTMEIHHTKHHQGYTDKANKILEKYSDLQDKSVCDILADPSVLKDEDRQGFLNNGGGYCNHMLFWKVMAPNAGGNPDGEVANLINNTFGNFETFQDKFSEAALSRFGSGWAWLVLKDGNAEIISTANQDSPLTQGYTRLLNLDVWEHAYYLKYQNRRPDYVKAWWNVVNWNQVNEFLAKGGV